MLQCKHIYICTMQSVHNGILLLQHTLQHGPLQAMRPKTLNNVAVQRDANSKKDTQCAQRPLIFECDTQPDIGHISAANHCLVFARKSKCCTQTSHTIHICSSTSNRRNSCAAIPKECEAARAFLRAYFARVMHKRWATMHSQ